MKKFKSCGCIFFILALLILLGGGVVLSRSSVQTKIANKALSEKFPESSVARIHIMPGTFEIEGLSLKLNDTSDIKLESAKGNFLTRALFTKSLEISSLEIKGLDVEIKDAAAVEQKPEEPLTEPQKKRLLTNPIKEPLPEYARKSSPLPKQKKEFPNWNISINTASADLSVKLPDESKIKSDILLKTFSSQKLVFPKTFDLAVKTLLSMKGLENENISLYATMVPSNGASEMKLAIERDKKRFMELSGKIDAKYTQMETQIQVKAESADIVNLINEVPDFKAHLFTQTNFDLDFSQAKTNLAFKLDAKNLKNFYSNALENPNFKFIHSYLEYVKVIDEISSSAEISGAFANSELSITNCDILLSANQNQVLHVKNVSPFKVNAQNIARIPDGELLQVAIPSLPTNMLNAFTGNAGEISGGNISALFSFSKKGDDFLVKTIKPLSAPNLKFSKNGNVLVSKISPTLEADISYNGESAAIHAILLANHASGRQLTGETKAAWSEKKSQASFDISGDVSSFINGENFPGDLDIAMSTSASLSQNMLTLENFKLKFLSPKLGEILSAKLLSKVAYDIAKRKPVVSGKFFEVESKDVPFDLFKPFSGGIDATNFSVQASASASGSDFIEADIGLLLNNMSFTKDREYLLRGLNIQSAAKLSFDTLKNSISADFPEMKISDEKGSLMLAKIKTIFVKTPALEIDDITANITGSVPRLLNQPALEKFNNASSGAFEINARLKSNKITSNLSLLNVSPKNSAESTGKIALQANGNIYAFALKDMELALTSESAKGKTDALLTATIGDEIKMSLRAETVATDDFELLAKAFTNPIFKDGTMRPETAGTDSGQKRLLRPNALPGETKVASSQTQNAAKPSQAAVLKDEKAAWDFGKNLSLDAKVNHIVRENKSIAKYLQGSLALDRGKVNLKSFTGEIFGAKLDTKAELIFTEEKIYSLENASATLKGLRIDEFMQPNSAGEKMFVGSFDIAANLSGKNAKLTDLGNTVKGKASMTSGGGLLHLLDKGSNVGVAVGVGSAALKISSAILGSRVKELGAIGDLYGMLSQMNYSNIHVHMERGNDLDIVVTDAEVRADHILLKTQGVLKHNPELSFADQAIYFPVKLYARKGNIQDLFGKIGLITGADGDGDFVPGPTFTISGTISNPKNNLTEVISAAISNVTQTESQSEEKQGQPKIGNAIGNILKNIESRKKN